MDTHRHTFMQHSQPHCFLHRRASWVREEAVMSRTDSNPNRYQRHDLTISSSPTLEQVGGGCPSDHLPGATDQVVYAAHARCASTRTG
jgi:hypothetical protein